LAAFVIALLGITLIGAALIGALGAVATPPGPRPPAEERGRSQEDRVRETLKNDGYETPFGETDAEIRSRLSIDGKTADFVGYHRGQDRWLIAESKGGDIQSAFEQIRNTARSLWTRDSSIVAKTELRVYTRAEQHAKFSDPSNGLAGWRLKDGFLGWIDDATDEWNYAEIDGVRIRVFVAP
jgi:hypothetical protein